ISSSRARNVMPFSTSTTPGRRMGPERPNTLVPGAFGVPSVLNWAAPPSTIDGMADSVSTLLITVGWPQRPDSTGNGGRVLGAAPCEGLEQRGLLAQDEPTGTATQLDAARHGGAQHTGADDAGRLGLCHGPCQSRGRQVGLAVNVQDDARRAHRVGREQRSL